MKSIFILVLILSLNMLTSSGNDVPSEGNEVPSERNQLCAKAYPMFKCQKEKCLEKCNELGEGYAATCVTSFLCLCTKIGGC
ncbi:hypothetical protein Hanom_Chr09g00781631 [Helianthus anomalus]